MRENKKKLLLVIHIQTQEDLLPIIEGEGWYTARDLFKKTSTLFNRDWNGKYALDLDEKPWFVSEREFAELKVIKGRVVTLVAGKRHVSDNVLLYRDRDGTSYALAEDLKEFLSRIGIEA
ncbi:MAG: hypothetical protein FJ118_00660 [Deltaproteobacteria bacterium]|nr:hypothetical protein [Deltaproteobacteria bacterium]